MDKVRYNLEETIAVIQLDDGKANALSPETILELHRLLDRAEVEATAVVILGRDKRLSAGFDLSVMTGGVEAMQGLVVAGAELLLRIYTFPRPIIIGCTGHALAAGAILLLVGDFRVGAEGDFKIGLNEVAIQMTLPTFGMELARDRLVSNHLTRATTQAQIYTPSEACAVGYLDMTTAPEAVAQASMEHARRLGALPQRAFHATKLKERHATVERVRTTLEADIRTITMG